MIERNKIEFKEYNFWYKGIKLDISPETIQDFWHNTISEETVEKAIKESYERNLRIHREKLLNELINKK
jgi:hypothetical protein